MKGRYDVKRKFGNIELSVIVEGDNNGNIASITICGMSPQNVRENVCVLYTDLGIRAGSLSTGFGLFGDIVEEYAKKLLSE